MRNLFWAYNLSVSVCTGACLRNTWKAGWIIFLFGIYAFVHHRSAPSEHEHSSSCRRCMGCVFRKIVVQALGAQTWNVVFSAIGFNGRTDFACVRYSVISSGLQKNSLLYFISHLMRSGPIEKIIAMSLYRLLYSHFSFSCSHSILIRFNRTRYVCKRPFSG
jgi:hypothetical protein